MAASEISGYRGELRTYVAGLIVALLLSALAFGAVFWRVWPRPALVILIAATAVVQVIAQLRLFLHVDLARSKRDQLQLILFSTLIAALMVAGTLVIFYNQMARMM